MIELRVIYETIDYTKYNQKPTKFVDSLVTYISTGSNFFNLLFFKIRKNTIITIDDYIQIGQS
jgi:hypothetical protein